ncbi:hypothetical protein GCM10008171_33080 [Methylopila jiangsuensis]|uniref:Uncharacterized protein n=1 Tax=Methylopila jiangsuensis TaxID=586230 RepID=A0A9W6N4E3_9HYPH|nr:hypothetical protein [Methylopila jiangsuensis]MDR6284558.1 hypothetical protein [Methylopila jiangsuensis]GLK78054.1 hypothetical protein GCM10008171_33080 [Methylopila jiangsuensis]
MSAWPEIPVDPRLETAAGIDVVVRIAWTNDEVSRLASSLIGLELPADLVEDEDGAWYRGLPGIAELPAFKQMMNGQADENTFTLSGLDPELAAIFDAEQHLAEGAVIHVGKVFYDANQQIIGGARWRWRGEGGEFGLHRAGGDHSLDGATRTVSLTATTDLIRRAGAQLHSWTDAQQQRLHPGDRGCERTNGLSTGKRKAWPKV